MIKKLKLLWKIKKVYDRIKEVIKNPAKLKDMKFIIGAIIIIIEILVIVGILDPEFAKSINQTLKDILP